MRIIQRPCHFAVLSSAARREIHIFKDLKISLEGLAGEAVLRHLRRGMTLKPKIESLRLLSSRAESAREKMCVMSRLLFFFSGFAFGNVCDTFMPCNDIKKR